MTSQSIFISESSLRNLKAIAARRLPSVQSAHLTEAIATSLGFATHAALRSALNLAPTVRTSVPQPSAFVRRLEQLGYLESATAWGALPNLGVSHSVFRQTPIKPVKGVRATAARNILVSAINAGVQQRIFGLSPGADSWASNKGGRDASGADATYRYVFAGNVPAIASVRDVGHDELSVHVVLNPKRDDVHPERYLGWKDGDAFVHGWFERKLGVWVQEGPTIECRRPLMARAAAEVVVPQGFGAQGSFFL